MSFLIYLMSIVDSLSVVITILFVILFVIIFASLSVSMMIAFANDLYNNEDDWPKFKKYWFLTFKIWIVISILGVLIPDSKTIAAMYLVPKITNNKQVQELPSKVVDVLNLKLDEWIGDLTKKEGSQKQ